MPPETPCPDAPALEQLLLGRVPFADGQPLYDHLAACDRCAEFARGYRADDYVDAALRHAAADEEAEDPSVAGLVAELTRRGPPGPEDDLNVTALSDTIPPSDEQDTGGDLFDFLAPAEAPDEIGRLGGYRVLKVLGAGGMGVVFHAEDIALQRPVALKAMRPALAGGASARRRFLGEGRAAAALRHDHIVPVYQVGEERGVPFLVMPLLRGESLEDRLRREGALPPAEVCRVGREIAQGLEAAHARGLVHRDVKPANVWLESDGEGESAVNGRVKILDFGLARPAAGAGVTQEGAIVGTPAYMAPEQAGGRPVDARTDLFALGCVLYHAATGKLPFRGADAVATLVAVAGERPRPPAEVNPAVPPALSALVMRLLAKDPAGRPASAREVAGLLARAGTAPRGPRLTRRRWALRALIAALCLGGLTVMGARLIVPTDRGEVSIETDDPDVEVVVKGDRVVRIVDPKTGRSYQLDRDDLTLTRTDDPDGLAVTLDGVKPVVLKRDGRKLVTLRLAAKPPNPLPPEKVGEVRRFYEGLDGYAWRTRPAFTADGRGVYATSLNAPFAVLLWDRNSGALLARHENHHGYVGFFSLSPDRKLAVLGQDEDGKVRLAEAPGGKVLRRLEGVKGEVWSSAISPAGDRVAAGDTEGYVYVWDCVSGKRLWLQHTDQRIVRGLAISPDGATLAVGGNGAGLQLFELETGKEIGRLGHNSSDSVFAKDGNRLITAGGDEAVIYDRVADKVVRRLPCHAPAETVALAPDELHLATGAQDGMVRWWDVNSGAEVLSFQAHPGGVLGVAVSPDGKYLASAGKDGTVRLWRLPDADAASAEKVGDKVWLEGYDDAVWGVAFSPDGRYTLTTGRRNLLRDGPDNHVVNGLGDGVWLAAFSPDGRRVLTGDSAMRAVIARDVRTGQEVRRYGAAAGRVFNAGFSPDGRRVAASEWDVVHVWDAATGEGQMHVPTQHDCRPAFAFARDGRRLAVIHSDARSIRIYDPETGKEVGPRLRSPGALNAVALSPDGKTVLATQWKVNEILVWDAASGDLVRQLADGPKGARSDQRQIAFLPDGRRALATTIAGTMSLWDVPTGRAIQRWDGLGDVVSLAVSSDGRRALCGRWDHKALLFRLPDPDGDPGSAMAPAPPLDSDEVRRFEGHADWVCNAVFHPDGRRVLSSSTDGTVRLWDRQTGECLRTYGNLYAHVWGLALSADGKTVAVSCSNPAAGAKTVARLWDVETGRPGREIPLPCGAMSADLAPDGRLLVAGEDGVARVFDAASGEPLCQFKEHTGNIRAVLFSKDGRYAFSGARDQSVRMWDSRTGQEARRFVGHTGWILALALSSDGRFLASGGDKTVRVWEVGTGRQVRCFEGHKDYVLSVAFSPDGRRLLSGDMGNQLRLWDAETGRVLLDRTSAGTVEAVRFSADGRLALFGGNDNVLRLWRLPD